MKSKYIKNICWSIFFFSLCSSCESFLTENPEGTVSAEKYFTTQEGYEYMVKGAYEPLRYVTRNKTPFILGTDVFTSPGPGLDDRNEADKVSYNKLYLQGFNEYFKNAVNASNGDLRSLFCDGYNLIQRANSTIAYGERADISQELRTQRIGEMKFLRALAYYYLVESFGDIPLLTSEVKTPELTAERTPEKDIYSFLISDLENCKNDVASKSEQSEFGRVTRGAIKTLLAKLYLTRAYKSYAEDNDARNAYTLAVDVIENEGYSLIDFAKLFEEGNEINDEIIFSVQYSTDLQTNWGGNTDYSVFQPFVYAIPGMGAKLEYMERYTGAYAPTRAAYKLYDRSWDKRFDLTFQREYFANETKDADQGAFGAVIPGQKMIQCIFPDEPPMTQAEKDQYPFFIVNFDEYYDQPLVGGIKDDNGDYRVNGFAVNEKGERIKARYFVYPGIKKFRDSKALYSDGGEMGTRDHFIFRLGEVYLIAAEASLKSGYGDGAHYLQELRNRASITGTAPSLDLTIDNILDERARELLGEERRFLELRRTDKLKERVFAKKMNERAVRALEVWGDQAFKDEYMTRALPYDWTRYLQNTIEQNPGYDY